MTIEVVINGKGQTQIPDQTQLRGTYTDSIVLCTPNVAAVSAVTGSTNIATEADLKNMTLSLLRASDNVIQQKPILFYNIVNDGGTTPNVFNQPELIAQPIDWNQSYIYMGATPSSTPIIVSLDIYYYNPNLVIPTDNMKLVVSNGVNQLINWVNAAISSMNGVRRRRRGIKNV